MRILRIIASMDPSHGGPVEGLKQSAVILIDLGHETEIVCLDDPKASFLADCPAAVHSLGPALGRYGFTPSLARWIRQNARRFDVAIVHGLWNHAATGAARALRRSGVPFVVFAHGMLDPWFNRHPLKRWMKVIYWTLLQRHVLTQAAAVLFTAEEEFRRARINFDADYAARVVAYGAAEPSPDKERQRAAFFNLLPQLAGRDYLLFLGRLHPKKGCDLLVEAFGEIAGQYPGLDLVVAGPDPHGLAGLFKQKAVQGSFAHRLHLPGMLNNDVKWGALNGAMAFVLPSHQENFGIAVAEAMACGVPVLISDKVNIWREVINGLAGFVAEDSQVGTRDLLVQFLGLSPEQRREMGVEARATYLRHFTGRRAAEDLLAVLEDVTGISAKGSHG